MIRAVFEFIQVTEIQSKKNYQILDGDSNVKALLMGKE
jgi:hypothetical protein